MNRNSQWFRFKIEKASNLKNDESKTTLEITLENKKEKVISVLKHYKKIEIRRRGILYYVRIDAKFRWQSWVRAGKSIGS